MSIVRWIHQRPALQRSAIRGAYQSRCPAYVAGGSNGGKIVWTVERRREFRFPTRRRRQRLNPRGLVDGLVGDVGVEFLGEVIVFAVHLRAQVVDARIYVRIHIAEAHIHGGIHLVECGHSYR